LRTASAKSRKRLRRHPTDGRARRDQIDALLKAAGDIAHNNPSIISDIGGAAGALADRINGLRLG
jgi:hypothetical protein